MMKSMTLIPLALLLTACGLAMDNEDRLARGEEALADGDYRAAIIDAKDVLRGDPENARARLLLGRVSAAVGDGAAAEKELRLAVDLGVGFDVVALPLARALVAQDKFQDVVDEIRADSGSGDHRVDLMLVRGDAFIGLGQPAAARELYSDVLQDQPDNVVAQLGIAASFAVEGNFAQARGTLDHAIATFPDNVRARLASGELNFRSRNFAGAEADYEVAAQLATAQNDVTRLAMALTGLAESQLALQRTDEARNTVDQLAALSPDSFHAVMLTSRIALIDGDWTLAQQNLQGILRSAPDYRPAQTLLGAVHLQSGNLSQAEMYLSAVVAATPGNDDARRLLAETRLQMQNVGEAEETLQPLIARQQADPKVLALAARARLVQGDVDAALEFLARGVAEEPTNSDLRFEYAIALMNAGRMQEFQAILDSIDSGRSDEDTLRHDLLATLLLLKGGQLDQGLVAAQELVNNWPSNHQAHNLLGSVQLVHGDIAAARESFERALAHQTGDLMSQRNLAMLDEREGNLEAARAHYESILELRPNLGWAMFGFARVAARSEDLGTAQEWLQQIREIDDKAVAPRAELSRILMTSGDFRQAEQVLDEALAVEPSAAELHNLLGKARVGREDHAGAVLAFRKAFELDATNAEFRLNLANSQRLAGDKELAERTLVDGGSVDLGHIPSAVTLAEMKVESGDLGEAMRIARALQERHPDSAIPYALEAEIHVRSERLEEAVVAYDRALAIESVRSYALRAHRIKSDLGSDDKNLPLKAFLADQPLDRDVRMVLAESLQRDNKLKESISEYEAVLAQDPENAVALNNLAWAYHLDDDVRASASARKAFEKMPESGAVADTLGWILLGAGETEEAVSILGQAVKLSNGSAEIRYHYAVGLSKQGKVDEARRVLQDVVGSGEDFTSREDAIRLLAEL